MQLEVEKRYEAYLKEQGIKKLHKSTENMVLKIKEATEVENGSKFIIEQGAGQRNFHVCSTAKNKIGY